MTNLPTYFIQRSDPADPTSALDFNPPKGSDELHEALKAAFPHLSTLQSRMRQAVIEFYLLEQQIAQEQEFLADFSPLVTNQQIMADVSPIASNHDSPDFSYSLISFPSAENSFSGSPDQIFNTPFTTTDNSFPSTPNFSINNSPELLDFSLTSLPNDMSSLFPVSSINSQASPSVTVFETTPASTTVPTQDELTSVWALPSRPDAKVHKRRCMTAAEKQAYKAKRLAGACETCKRRRRKCTHNNKPQQVLDPQEQTVGDGFIQRQSLKQAIGLVHNARGNAQQGFRQEETLADRRGDRRHQHADQHDGIRENRSRHGDERAHQQELLMDSRGRTRHNTDPGRDTTHENSATASGGSTCSFRPCVETSSRGHVLQDGKPQTLSLGLTSSRGLVASGQESHARHVSAPRESTSGTATRVLSIAETSASTTISSTQTSLIPEPEPRPEPKKRPSNTSGTARELIASRLCAIYPTVVTSASSNHLANSVALSSASAAAHADIQTAVLQTIVAMLKITIASKCTTRKVTQSSILSSGHCTHQPVVVAV